ncbi:1,2-dihydroxy-3-keto-5-methylthiopentene dioxygenase [Pseudomonas huanghezhanensis]|uniref:1,2-dihydroxy-3-keto-5-methylthiopentene dioxygenase n=1 Tax=Pseudomonas huanghezhanensis TaxID=3002903 RepID=UPI002285B22D|nr:acireductone dioxygenase [Pseudomonas sp. BSw22131]
MSTLSVYHVSSPDLPNKVLTHFEDIASTLAEQGVTFERWQAPTPITPRASQEEVINAYRAQIDTLSTERGYGTVDVMSLSSDHPQKAEYQARFLEEHQHAGDEMRFFVAGRGLFTLHIGDLVFAVLCEKNDLVSVPAGTRQWIDMGENPHLVAIRLFNHPEGSVATFTGENTAGGFPSLDD